MKESLKVSPKRDFMFRALFSKNDNVDLLEDLISSIIGRKVKIKNVLREARIGEVKEESKYGTLDIKAKLETGEDVDIEMQMKEQECLLNRAIFYASALTLDNFKKKQAYSEILPKIVIFILNYIEFEYDEVVNESFMCLKKHREEEISDLYKYYIVELPKVKNLNDVKYNNLKRWIAFFNQDKKEMEKLGRTKVMEKAQSAFEYLTGDEEIQRLEWLKLKGELEYNTMKLSATRKGMEEGLKQGIEKGIKKGIREGRKEGRKENNIMVAKNMLKNGIKIEIIMDCTKLSKKEIEELKS